MSIPPCIPYLSRNVPQDGFVALMQQSSPLDDIPPLEFPGVEASDASGMIASLWILAAVVRKATRLWKGDAYRRS